MKSVLKILTSLAFLSVNFMTAQQVVKNDTISGTPLSVTMDKRIDDLMTSMAVSYTHLDVYKRQGNCCCRKP